MAKNSDRETPLPTNCHYFKISWIQNIKVYKTQAHFFVVGSNYADTKFRLLKIRRTDPWDLIIIDDGVDYNYQQMCCILEALLGGATGPLLGKSSKKIAPKYTGYGIIGFVRFVEGYYLILATKQSKVADIGGNVVYKIEDTAMIYIPNNNVKISHADEWRYLKAFQNVDLSSNFYFSYSYDLTNNLQHNMLLLQSTHLAANKSREAIRDMGVESDGSTGESWVYVSDNELAAMKEEDETNVKESGGANIMCSSKRVAVASNPCDRFLWNKYLLEPLEFECVSELWSIKIIHGHISQTCVNVYGKPIYITLIGRRSCRYAGTRFMKRGCNVNGDVANEVETEQIVHCASSTSLHHTQFTSYIQHRGSVPVHWSQDITASVVPAKPPIVLSLDNPYSQATARHFQAMMQRYGSPIMVLNLVRKREKRFRESVLGQEFKLAIDYLNQFLSAEHQIKYFAFDMAHQSRNSNVITRLAEMANYTLQATGIFQSKPHLFKSTHDKDPRWRQLGGQFVEGFRIQTGVLRTNCVDCLDRTNSAQFVAGKSALAYQLFSLGVLSEPNLNFDTDVTRLYEDMFNQHGDIIALQYGGSQLVHTIQTYRRTIAPWASHSRDIVTTLSRYYSNTFSDADKQSAINLFLGVFKPHPTQDPLWELSTDYYLHNHDIDILKSFSMHNYLRWLYPQITSSLPLPLDTVLMIEGSCRKFQHDTGLLTRKQLTSQCEDYSDWFSNFHRVEELTSFDECLALNMNNTLNSCIAYGYADLSPFTVRGENWQHLKHERLQPDSTTSQSSHEVSSNESSDSDENEVEGKRGSLSYDVTVDTQTSVLPWQKPPTIDEFSPQNMYGIDIEHATSAQDEKTYRRYVDYEELLVDQGPYVNEMVDGDVKLQAVDPQSMLIYVDSVSHNYQVDAEFYRDYFRQFNTD